MKLKRGKVSLRHALSSDAYDYFKCHDEEAKKNFFSVPKSLKEAKQELSEKIEQYFLPYSKRHEDFFIIEFEGHFAGWISVHDIFYKHKAVSASLVCPKFRGKGIGTLAHKLLLKYAFEKYQLVRIFGRVRSFNKPSAKMLENAGYKLEGVLKKDHFQNGRYFDNLLYAKTK